MSSPTSSPLPSPMRQPANPASGLLPPRRVLALRWQRLRRTVGPVVVWLVMLLLSLLAAAAHAAVDRGASLSSTGDGFGVVSGVAHGANKKNWWQAFDDPALAGVMQAAGSAPAAQATVMQAYVSWRVAQARGALAARVQQAALEQQQLLGQPEHAPAEQQARLRELVRALTARGQFWAGVQQQMADACDRAEVQIAAVIRKPRADVQALLSQGSASGSSNDIGDDANADADDTAAVSLPQVRANLPAAASQRLQSGNAQALQARILMEASRLELRAQQLRQQAGTESPLAVLEAYQRWVADADRLAVLAGTVAMAWAQWLQGGGSVGNSVDDNAGGMLPTSAATALPVRGTDPALRAR